MDALAIGSIVSFIKINCFIVEMVREIFWAFVRQRTSIFLMYVFPQIMIN